MENDDSDLLIPTPQQLGDKYVKSYFQKENYIPDHITKMFNTDVEITKESIKNLNERVMSKFRIHTELGLVISVDIKFEDRKTLHFGTWTDYSLYDWEDTAPISNIVLTWSINAKFRDMNFPQKHSLTVKLSNGIKPEEMLNIIFSGNLSEVTELENNFFPVVAQCTFVDRTFGNELVELVGRWVDSVKRSTWTGRKFLKFAKKNKSKLSQIVNFITRAAILFGSLFAFLSITDKTLPDLITSVDKETIILTLEYFGFLLITWMFSDSVSKWFAKTIYDIIDNYGHSYIFSITKSDLERRNKMQKQEFYDKIKLGLLITVNVAVNTFFILLDRLL